MGKICDPPLFTGGQIPDVYYNIEVTSRVEVDGYPYPTVSVDTYRALLGKITAVETDKYDTNIYGNRFSYATIRNLSQYGAGSVRLNLNSGYQPSWHFSIDGIRVYRTDGQADSNDNLPSQNCRCSDDSCRVDCNDAPDGFCCIDHAVTDRLLQVLQN